jgi:Tol biopolymer transport system component/DNA-binding winged helix-turn-helix (wHTH) protein
MTREFYLGPWLVQPSLGRLSLDGRTVQVRPKVMDLLVYLADVPGSVVSKETLLDDVWHTDAISESALTRTITELRAALGDDAGSPRILETIPKRGYRLIAPVRPVPSPQGIHPNHRLAPLGIGLAALLIAATLALLVFVIDSSESIDAVRLKPLTTLRGQEGQPSFSPDGKQVALVWSGEADDNFDVYIKTLDGESLVRVTTAPEPDRSPAWSPDGRAIAFVRDSKRGVELYIAPASGGPERIAATLRRRRTSARQRILDWSFDGRALVVVDQDSPDEPFYIASVSLETGERQKLTSPPPGSFGDINPAVSPDGRRLAFARSIAPGPSDIHIVSMKGGEPDRLTFDDTVISGLTWSEDGGSLVFSSERGAMAGAGGLWRIRVAASRSRAEPQQIRGIGQRAIVPVIARRGGLLAYLEHFQDTNLWRIATNGRESPQPLIASTREENLPDYSADGARIAFSSNRSGNWETWIAEADGSKARQVTFFAAAPASASRWSPDGRLLAFHHAVEGNSDIFTITPEGSSLRRLTSEPSTEETPSWCRDGRSIYLSSNRSGMFEIWKVTIDQTAPPLQLTHGGGLNPRESADGQRVFYVKGMDSALEIWSTAVDGGAETRVLGPIRSRAGWAPDRNGMYFIDPAGQIGYYRFATGGTSPIVAMRGISYPYNPALALSPDGGWLLYAQIDRYGADMMLAENFR